jgi:hypothetical protein
MAAAKLAPTLAATAAPRGGAHSHGRPRQPYAVEVVCMAGGSSLAAELVRTAGDGALSETRAAGRRERGGRDPAPLDLSGEEAGGEAAAA